MKNILTFSLGFAGLVALGTLTSPQARATELLDDSSDSITAASLTQLGRVSRNGVQQTWDPADDGETAYPGAINTTTTYNYVTYTFTPLQLGNGQYVQIDFQEPAGAADLFVSAWTTFTGTASLTTGTGYLGDAGQSRDYAFTAIPPTPQDPRFFNVTVPTGDTLTVVVNTTAATAIGETYGLDVEAYSTTDYGDISAIPEPSTWVLLGLGAMLGGAAVLRRRADAA